MRMRHDFLGQLALGIRGKRDPRLAGVPGFGQPNVGPGQPQTPGIGRASCRERVFITV